MPFSASLSDTFQCLISVSVDFCFPVCHNRKCVFLVNLFYITVSLLPLFRVAAHRAMWFVGSGTGERAASDDDKIQEIWRGVMGYFVYLYKIGCGSATPIPGKQSFPVLLLHSPFAIFVKNRMRLGNAKVRKS